MNPLARSSIVVLGVATVVSAWGAAPAEAQDNPIPLNYRNLNVNVLETYGNNNTRRVAGARVVLVPENGGTDEFVEFPIQRTTTNRGVVSFSKIPPSNQIGPYVVTVTYPRNCGEETKTLRMNGGSDNRVTFNVNCAQRRYQNRYQRQNAQRGGNRGGGGGNDEAGGGGTPETVLAVENIRLNRAGKIQGDVVLKEGPMPSRGMALVTFAWGDPHGPTTETIRTGGIQFQNRPRSVTTRKVFPCDATYPVTARVEPMFPANRGGGSDDGDDDYTRVELTRTCSRTQGTPNLVVEEMKRVSTNKAPEAPVTVRVTVKNDSNYDMADNEMGGTPWAISVQSATGTYHTVRRALKAGETYSYNVNVAVDCDAVTDLRVVVDARRNIDELDENDNEAEFPVEGNYCQDAG